MARRQGLLEKANRMREDLSRSELLNRRAEWKESHLDRDTKGRFVSRAQEKANRDYLVTLRAQINHEDFKVFRNALGMISDDVSGWATGINKTLGFVSDAFKLYQSLGIGGVNREATAIDFANRLGLSLSQGRAWSRTFDRMEITSFDQWAEVTRNPLRLAKALNIYQEEEKASQEMRAPEIQEGIGVLAKMDRAMDTLSIRFKNFGEQIVLANTKVGSFTDRLADIIQNFNPRVDPKSLWQTTKNVAGETGKAVSGIKEAIDEATFHGFTSATLGSTMGAASKVVSSSPALAAIAVGTEAITTGRMPWKTTGSLATLWGLQKALPGLSKLLGKAGIASTLWGGFDQSLAKFPRDATWGQRFGFKPYSEEQLKAKEKGEWVSDFEKVGESYYDFQKALGIWWGEYQKELVKKHPVEEIDLGSFPEPVKSRDENLPQKEESFRMPRAFKQEGDLLKHKESEPLNISYNFGNIIVNVPPGTDTRSIGSRIMDSIEKTRANGPDSFNMSSNQIAKNIGRVS